MESFDKDKGKGDASLQKKDGQKWVKLIRVLIYLIAVVGIGVGGGLIKSGYSSASYANGTAELKTKIGLPLFYACLILLCLNILWGVLRWFLRCSAKRWKAGRIIGSLIGGCIWRVPVFVALFLISILAVEPAVDRVIANGVSSQPSLVSLSKNYERLEYIKDNLSTLNYDEIKDELCGLLFCNIRFGVDASANVSRSGGSWLFQNASAYSPTVTVLNKARLSDGGHFVAFYTDTGDDAVSEVKVDEVVDLLETIISNYSSRLGFEYSYEREWSNFLSGSTYLEDGSLVASDGTEAIKSVLTGSGVDSDALEYAMPIYVVNPYKNGSSTLATYAGVRFNELAETLLLEIGEFFGVEEAKLYTTVPSFPFINVRSDVINSADSKDLPIVLAHELGHHYVALYSYANYNGIGSDQDFIDETTPDWMAINVLPNQPADSLINGDHHLAYLSASVGDSIKDASLKYGVDGYPAVAFLENYYEVVPNAKAIIMDATYYGDALEFLYDHAGEGDFRKVMLSLAEKNLTGDYDGKLINTVMPQGEAFGCTSVCEEEYSINPAALNYFYFSPAEYYNSTVYFASDNENITGSLFGRKSDGNWEKIEVDVSTIEFGFTNEVLGSYDLVVLGVANVGIVNKSTFRLRMMKEGAKQYFPPIFHTDGMGCYEIDTNALFDNLTGVVGAGLKLFTNSALKSDEFDTPAERAEAIKEQEDKADEATSVFSKAKSDLAPYAITACFSPIASNDSFQTTKENLKTTFGGSFDLFDNYGADGRESAFLSFDLFAKRAKIYLLTEQGGDMGLLTVDVVER